ncbi:hypothetical protein [Phenylobacterium deserti]|uniref:Uncharacterized protein n=1 Tax=Phenylobacterium deserti TaxID=1914756 RepID=A0A328AY35_9CAUL|nr:hypothetical protein [Phenylobacterium deserti]RAK57748.1 hypothetical protein DJ018_07450 [Phenylobacterium deserti]
MDKKPTHVVVPEPELGVRYLSDYMSGSERKKRSILVAAKYRPLARLIQHQEAKATIVNAAVKGLLNKDFLLSRADFIRGKLVTDDFEALVNEANSGYLVRFSEVVSSLDLAGLEVLPGKKHQVAPIGGLKVPFVSNLLLRKVSKTNKVRVGALMLRYSKGKELPKLTAEYQSALIFGLLQHTHAEAGAEIDPALCLTLDCHTGSAHPAPSKAVTMFKNVSAACATIADAWPNTMPPQGAVLKGG